MQRNCTVRAARLIAPPRRRVLALSLGVADAGMSRRPRRGLAARAAAGPTPRPGAGSMIELVSPGRCTGCNICVHICPMNVFDRAPDALASIAQ